MGKCKNCIWAKSSTDENGVLGKPKWCINRDMKIECKMYLVHDGDDNKVKQPYQIYNDYHNLLMPYFEVKNENRN